MRHRARPPAIRAALPGILLVMFLAALDQTVMASALPSVAGDLHGLDRMPAIITSYLVAATAAMPLAGKLGDAFGRKRILQSALAILSQRPCADWPGPSPHSLPSAPSRASAEAG